MKRIFVFCLAFAVILSTFSIMAFATVNFGDINTDSEINEADLGRLSQYLAKWDFDFTEEEFDAADVYCDQEIDAFDAVVLARYLAGFDVELGGESSFQGVGDVEINADDLFS